jgi:cytoskeletal protein CcmA (bactofilin family)
VSGHALTTFCPNCNATINLSDVTVSSIASKPIDTRGKLTVTPSGHLSSALTICGEAFVDGRVTGTLVCETTLTLAGSRRFSCQMVAASIVIERRASLEFISPVRAGNLTVHGRARGTFECGGEILVAKGGLIEGRIAAKSVIVEHGGILLADSTVRPRKRGKFAEDEESEGPFFVDSLPAAY